MTNILFIMYTDQALVLREKCSYHILILKNFIADIVGDHYPIEIIHVINAFYLELHHLSLLVQNDRLCSWRLAKYKYNGILSVNCGGDHTVVMISNDLHKGQIYYLGEDHGGLSPKKLNLYNILSVDCGTKYIMATSIDGQLYSWGQNLNGQLGLGDTHNRNSPVKINLSNILSISCGGNHTMAVTMDKLYGWGLNTNKQLGNIDSDNVIRPTKIDLMLLPDDLEFIKNF